VTGGAVSFSITSTGKVALALFDGLEGHRVFLNITSVASGGFWDQLERLDSLAATPPLYRLKSLWFSFLVALICSSSRRLHHLSRFSTPSGGGSLTILSKP